MNSGKKDSEYQYGSQKNSDVKYHLALSRREQVHNSITYTDVADAPEHQENRSVVLV